MLGLPVGGWASARCGPGPDRLARDGDARARDGHLGPPLADRTFFVRNKGQDDA